MTTKASRTNKLSRHSAKTRTIHPITPTNLVKNTIKNKNVQKFILRLAPTQPFIKFNCYNCYEEKIGHFL